MVIIKAHIYRTLTMSQALSSPCCSLVSFILDNNPKKHRGASQLFREGTASQGGEVPGLRLNSQRTHN